MMLINKSRCLKLKSIDIICNQYAVFNNFLCV